MKTNVELETNVWRGQKTNTIDMSLNSERPATLLSTSRVFAMWRRIYSVSPVPQLNNDLKVEVMFKSSFIFVSRDRR